MAIKVPGTWEAGESFDGYVIESVLGKGGMGFVYKARQTALDRHVAIKTLLPQHLDKAEYLARFLREGKAATRIRSRHVVQVYDVRQRGDVPYLVMEFLEGVPLDEHIAKGGAMEPELAVEVMLAVCDAVAAAHRVGVIHRDLKPANVFLTRAEDGSLEPKVVDFGISRLQDSIGDGLQTGSQALLGTPAYLSPEQIRGSRHVTERSDQYALGVILYECLTGRLAFPDNDFFVLIARIGMGEFEAPRKLRPELSEALEAVLLRAMARDPSARFDSVSSLGAALLPFANDRVRARWSSVFGVASDGAVSERPSSEAALAETIVRSSSPQPAAHDSPAPLRSTLGGATRPLPEQPRKRERRWLLWAGAPAITLVLIAAFRMLRPAHPTAPGVHPASPSPSVAALSDAGGPAVTVAPQPPPVAAAVSASPVEDPAPVIERHGRHGARHGHRGASTEAAHALVEAATTTPRPVADEPASGTNGASIR